MNKGFMFCAGLILGVGGGGVIAYKMLEQRFDQKSEEEIASVREALLNEVKQLKEQLKEKDDNKKEADANEAMRKYNPEQEKPAEHMDKPAPKPEPAPTPTQIFKEPYTIPAELFDSPSNPNEQIGIKLYTDGVFTDAYDKAIDDEDLVDMIGATLLQEIRNNSGYFEDTDRICVRNDRNGLDYEVCQLARKYSDVLKTKPYLRT